MIFGSENEPRMRKIAVLITLQLRICPLSLQADEVNGQLVVTNNTSQVFRQSRAPNFNNDFLRLRLVAF